jgi:hypothetical protein
MLSFFDIVRFLVVVFLILVAHSSKAGKRKVRKVGKSNPRSTFQSHLQRQFIFNHIVKVRTVDTVHF